MILFDAVFVNNGGAKVLLDLLLNELFILNKDIIYLLDERVEGCYNFLEKEKVFYIPGSLKCRHLFYLKNKRNIKKVFVFGNIPPTIYLKNSLVYTYFHNVSLLEREHCFGFENLIHNLKSFILQFLKKNTNYWIVQTSLVKRKIKNHLNIKDSDVLIYPIFNDRNIFNNIYKDPLPNDVTINYLYVSEGYSYKGHNNLTDAFIKYNKNFPDTKLILTVSEKYSKSLKFNKKYFDESTCIINKGNLNHTELMQEYANANFFIFPSFYESLGLGLIEAALSRLPIIASDLEYVFEVVQPTLVFNPKNIDDIYSILVKSREHLGECSSLIIKNKLKELTKLIVE